MMKPGQVPDGHLAEAATSGGRPPAEKGAGVKVPSR